MSAGAESIIVGIIVNLTVAAILFVYFLVYIQVPKMLGQQINDLLKQASGGTAIIACLKGCCSAIVIILVQ
ncbi:TPA: hypothetical protein TUW76_000968 [Streptococcus equi subsp. zooepidemicus]|uniref:hypothetical protein n=1 Tax=Streptococcus equi TaxID=1336 RepID=UPI0013F638C9|nr:hypothetical protein [Streptococcus equi]MCD3387240.1 hypothetical protein [Streptococcus equi subsp. zooepidemicus]MCD3439410.1 hypothetical protein [Streptococcus equi subsp. zooepidemicus]HEK9987916.1 hypothetical protein [Streptococcus equi subsp. zooepidemicus]HEK9996959.1 hypothetical protein [Streptococcus equi subsp. zooepidemicus]HEL0521736.1 hypothetical protein [Streptococcus equi subsp. zooepidemicus]